MYYDLVGLSDRVWGWKSNYRHLQEAAVEGIARHPLAYIKGVTITILHVMFWHQTQAASEMALVQSVLPLGVPNGRGLPEPFEHGMLPFSRLWWLASSPDNRVEYDWPYFFAHGSLIIKNPLLQSRLETAIRRVNKLLTGVPSRNGSPRVALWLNKLINVYPPAGFLLLIGAVGIGFLQNRKAQRPPPSPGLQRSRENCTLAFVTCLGCFVLLITYLGIFDIFEFRIAFTPLFVLLGTVGLGGCWTARNPSAKEHANG
jgi:hypothetical protein